MVENTFLKAKKIYSKLKIFIAGNVGELACPSGSPKSPNVQIPSKDKSESCLPNLD